MGKQFQAKDGVVEHLNNILTIELTAINQYFVQSEMGKNWSFNRMANSPRSNSFMVRSEEEHVDWVETQLETIKVVGLDLFLNQQIHGED